jgi:hypothetical protein
MRTASPASAGNGKPQPCVASQRHHHEFGPVRTAPADDEQLGVGVGLPQPLAAADGHQFRGLQCLDAINHRETLIRLRHRSSEFPFGLIGARRCEHDRGGYSCALHYAIARWICAREAMNWSAETCGATVM